jgi:DNA invertase Pin-like site-specific DNA recombinase
MIACYVRVSSPQQKNDSQKAEIMRWLKRNDFEQSSVTWFEDTERGKTLKRPGLARLRKSIFDGSVKTIVVWKIDRLSRNQRDGINLLADWCERGVRVVSVTQQIDLNGAVGRTVASVLFGLAEIESEYRRERQSAGISVARSRGVYSGRQKGTTKAKPPRAQELRRRGLTVAEVANALAVSERTAFRYLSRDTDK